MVLDWNSDGLESRFWSYLFNRFIDRKRSSERRHGCSYLDDCLGDNQLQFK